jgi:predicted lipoprotein with Yx(FWY)xxD motif
VHAAAGARVALRKTALGTILVDSRGRTLYLFEKDSNGMSMYTTATPGRAHGPGVVSECPWNSRP